MKRNFVEWLGTFKDNISDYKYYINFDKVYKNVEENKVEFNMLNSLLGSKNIEEDFINLVTKYPEVLKCIPILLAVRNMEIPAMDEEGAFIYNFKKMNQSLEQYIVFMNKTGLFDLLANRGVTNIIDFVLGVETGLDSNGRKNRGGHLMENLIEGYLKSEGVEYYKEMYLKAIEEKWGVNLSSLSNNGKSAKRFDFVVKTNNMIYGIETNFYTSGGSKLNETARSYKMIAEESKNIEGFKFVWFTDGKGWTSAKKNLEETFDVLDTMYNINDVENGVMKELFK
ncbi:type II restriction endonuclease [uncultured Clostridium sp.]|uniref:type II restriction endonuclease n=2 Tax=uncultured Clostridium sp. TaxID=59620 RepID=UPI002600A9A0|nr:type II restriction endonuclease [uncultured Clostridium sp.]